MRFSSATNYGLSVQQLRNSTSQHFSQSAIALSIRQGIVAGIGYLRTGSIIKGNAVEDIKGLMTAAGIWLTATIGVVAGNVAGGNCGESTILAIMILATASRFSHFLQSQEKSDP